MMGEYQVTARKLEKSLEKTRIDMIKIMRGVSQLPNRRLSGPTPNPNRKNHSGEPRELPPDDQVVIGIPVKGVHRKAI